MPTEAFGYIAAIIMGMVVGTLGGGGSILTVPILVYLFHLPATQASGDSLFVVGVTAAFGAAQYARRGFVEGKTGLLIALPSVLGTFVVRRWVVPALPATIATPGGYTLTRDALLLLVFAALMTLSAVNMIRPHVEQGIERVVSRYAWLATAVRGLTVGLLAGFVGAGGGFLVVPALVLFGGLAMRMAVGTSLIVIALNSLMGFVGDLLANPNRHWELMLPITALALVGNVMGVWLSRRIPDGALKPAFGWFVLCMAGYIAARELHVI